CPRRSCRTRRPCRAARGRSGPARSPPARVRAGRAPAPSSGPPRAPRPVRAARRRPGGGWTRRRCAAARHGTAAGRARWSFVYVSVARGAPGHRRPGPRSRRRVRAVQLLTRAGARISQVAALPVGEEPLEFVAELLGGGQRGLVAGPQRLGALLGAAGGHEVVVLALQVLHHPLDLL